MDIQQTENQRPANFGRRKTDWAVSEVLSSAADSVIGDVVNKVIEKRVNEILTGDMLAHLVDVRLKTVVPFAPGMGMVKVKRADNTIVIRRPRRTRKALRESFKKAIADTVGQHPDWTLKRIKRYAKNLVRLYKF